MLNGPCLAGGSGMGGLKYEAGGVSVKMNRPACGGYRVPTNLQSWSPRRIVTLVRTAHNGPDLPAFGGYRGSTNL